MNIGWLGLGNMGIPMTKRLLQNGHKVTVYNRTSNKSLLLAQDGATVAENPLQLLNDNNLIFIMLSDDNAVTSVFNDEKGFFCGDLKDKIFINMSTVSPETNKSLAKLVKIKGGELIDAPVSGSVIQAEQGQLIIMGGGDKNTFDQLTPIFDSLGKLSVYIGESGRGNELKLIINSLLAIFTLGFSESVLAAESNGISQETFFNVLNNSALSNIFLKIKSDLLINNNFNAAFALRHLTKDLELAKSQEMLSKMGEVSLNAFQSASAKYGDEDVIAIKKLISDK